jgi:hypothetical protein
MACTPAKNRAQRPALRRIGGRSVRRKHPRPTLRPMTARRRHRRRFYQHSLPVMRTGGRRLRGMCASAPAHKSLNTLRRRRRPSTLSYADTCSHASNGHQTRGGRILVDPVCGVWLVAAEIRDSGLALREGSSQALRSSLPAAYSSSPRTGVSSALARSPTRELRAERTTSDRGTVDRRP